MPASSTLDKREEMVEIPPPVATAPAPAAAEAPAPKDDKAAKAADPPKAAEPPKPAAHDKPAAAVPIKAEVKPEPKSDAAHKADTKHDAKPVDKPDDARAVALLEGKADNHADNPADRKSDRIVLQVGAFSTQAKIDEVRGKLKKAGIAVYTEKVPAKSGDVTRIRVGPLTSKEEAAKMRAKLAKLGFDAKPVSGEH